MKFHTEAQVTLGRHHTRIYWRRRNNVWDLQSPELMRKQLSAPGNRFALLDALAKLRKATISFVMSVRPSVRPSAPQRNNSAPNGWIFMNFDI
jgi:hypothetical protein